MEVLIDERVKGSLDGEVPSIGLIVGAYTKRGLWIIHMAETRDDSESQTEEKVSLITATPSLITHHTTQLLRMLPGGLDILGLYIVDPNNDPNKTKQLLQSVVKGLKKSSYGNFDKEKIILNFWNGKFTSEKGFKFGKVEFEMVKVNFDLSGVTVQCCKSSGDSRDLKDNLSSVLKAVKETLDKSVMIIEGEYPNETTIYKETSDINILVDKLPAILLDNNNEDFVNHLHLQGIISATGFVPKGQSTFFTAETLKQDIMRSVSSRVEMHCESLIDETSESVSKVYHEIPRRVFVPLLDNILVSDYLFPGEGPKDSINSFLEIINIVVSEQDFIDSGEVEFDLDELHHLKGSMEELLKGETLDTKRMSNVKIFIILSAITFAIFAILFAINR